MRWWLNADHGRFSVDNAAVGGMDFSTLPENLWMVQWTDGKGEIEYQVDAATNDNGLREEFIDVVPYAPFFQQFLHRLPRLTLPQAKKVQIDLIRQIFESKRQAPYHYPVAAGDYTWDATDQTLMSSTIPAIQSVVAALNSLISKLNVAIPGLKTVDANITTQGNSLSTTINSYIVTPANTALSSAAVIFAEVNSRIVDHLNNVVLGNFSGGAQNSINNKTRSGALASSEDVAKPGLSGDIAHASSIDSFYGATSLVPTVFAPGAATWTNEPPATTGSIQWIPIGATAPVTVTAAEQTGILNGIAARTNALTIKKNIKIGEVSALTELIDVINYDVTTGW